VFRGPGAAWLVLYEDGVPVACGGLRPLAPDTGEIKRMFVAAPARGRGHARRLLAELEAIARAAGQEQIRLITTEVLAEARALYASAGYAVASTEQVDGRTDYWLVKRL
jgi:GNAT superfamily N-acetyltransferase